MSNSNDFPSSKRAAGRKGGFPSPWCCSVYLFHRHDVAGGKLGVSFSIVNLLWIAVIGNALLALCRVAGLDRRAQRLNTVLMGRFAGDWQQAGRFYSWLCRVGWYAWGTATVAISLVKILALPEAPTSR